MKPMFRHHTLANGEQVYEPINGIYEHIMQRVVDNIVSSANGSKTTPTTDDTGHVLFYP